MKNKLENQKVRIWEIKRKHLPYPRHAKSHLKKHNGKSKVRIGGIIC
jgi:hypothetical protein